MTTRFLRDEITVLDWNWAVLWKVVRRVSWIGSLVIVSRLLAVAPGQIPDAAIMAHALAFGAILNTVNQDPLTELKPLDQATKQSLIFMLANSWDVHLREEMLDMLDGMISGKYGHRMTFQALDKEFRAAPNHGYLKVFLARCNDQQSAGRALIVVSYLRAPQTPRVPRITAWDFGRYVNLCCWGYGANYLTEQEAWDRILPVARYLQASYPSWDAYAEDYLLGREFWAPEISSDDHTRMHRIADALLHEKNSVWSSIPWEQSLGDGPVLHDKLADK